MKKYLFILVIIFVTFLSGCTVQSTKPKHGLTFEDMKFAIIISNTHMVHKITSVMIT